MKIYNQLKTEILENPDLELGYLVPDKIKTTYHEATKEIQEQSHLKIVKEYPNGGKDVEKIIDVAYQPAKEAYYDYEDIQVYIPYTEKDLAQREVGKLKQELAKWKEDVEQVELFGMERADYEQKKTRCAEIIVQLRELEKVVENE